ncbi:hypothetical protein F3087_00705 [Nocardia colli]|uniref:Restriction endonuclease n=1 Tax=Nocardia colli TaxID=2545717 RepID=A0A5N0ELJ9_9NOCA|nr:hypothetical protein [Nocardia colli]KAA8889883.1 hypothetical protein F3087_00705 [Nocardia colli]
MPRRTNPFQELVAILTAHMSAGAVVTESKMLLDLDTGQEREVDICVEQTVAGHLVRVCIECSSHGRPRDVTWVENMHGKHLRLPTNLLVLASESGFTGPALRKAESFRIETVVPGRLPESFGADVVGKLEQLVIKTLDLVPEKIRFTMEATEESPEEIVIALDDQAIFWSDGSFFMDALSFARGLVNHKVVAEEALPDAAGDERSFMVGMDPVELPDPETGQMHALFLRKEDPTGDYLRRIARVVVTGPAAVGVTPVPLTHGELRGAGYSTGSAVIRDHRAMFVVTETNDGQHMVTTRFTPEGNPRAGTQRVRSGSDHTQPPSTTTNVESAGR